MSKGWLILLISGAAVFVGVKAAQTAKTAENIYDKIKYSFSNIKLKISKAVVYLSTDISITNLSNMTIPIQNLGVLVQYKKNNNWSDLSYTKKSIPSIVIKANNTVKVPGLMMDVGLGLAAYNLLLTLGGKITELKIITTFYFQGFEQRIEQIVPISAQPVNNDAISGIDDGDILLLVTAKENPVIHGVLNADNIQTLVA